MKNQRVFLFVLLGAFAIAGLHFSIHAEEREPSSPYILVVGEGEVLAKPDQAILNFAIESNTKEAKRAQEDNSRKAISFLNALKKVGVQDKNIQTNVMRLSPKYDYINGKQILSGYVAYKNFEVRLDDIDRYGTVLQAALDSGVNQIGGVQFDHSKKKDLENEALKRAVLDAKTQADIMASAVEQKLGEIISMEAGATHAPRPMPYHSLKMAAMESSASDQLAPGESTIQATVTVKFKVRP